MIYNYIKQLRLRLLTHFELLNILKEMITNVAKEVKDAVSEKNKDNKDITDEIIIEVSEEEYKNKEE